MAGGPLGVKHPAKMALLLCALCSAIGFLLTMIAIFVPWSWKNTAVFERTYVGIWWNCVEHTNDPLNAYTCRTNDIDIVGSVAGGSEKCRGYIVATQYFTVAGNVWCFLALVSSILTLGKLWSKPTILGLYTCLMAFLAFSHVMIAFLMWIVYAEQKCQPGNPLFPLSSYSWGWICVVVATFFTLLAMLLSYVGLLNILRYKPFLPAAEPTKETKTDEGPLYLNPQYLQGPSSPFGYPMSAYPTSTPTGLPGYAPPAYMPYPMF